EAPKRQTSTHAHKQQPPSLQGFPTLKTFVPGCASRQPSLPAFPPRRLSFAAPAPVAGLGGPPSADLTRLSGLPREPATPPPGCLRCHGPCPQRPPGR